MKLLGFIVLIATAGQITAQSSDFVDYLLKLQSTTLPLQQFLMDANNEARYNLGMELTWLNDEAVHEITENLRVVIEIRDTTENSIAEISTPENEECINEATASWAEDLLLVGRGIQTCADAHVDPIYNKTEGYHFYMQDNNKLEYDLQNMVLKTFTDLNPLTEAYKITSMVRTRTAEINDQYLNVVKVEIERRLIEISGLRRSVPGEIHICISEVVKGLDVTANRILDAVRAC